MAGEIAKPHDHLFRSVFGEEREAEAAGLLMAAYRASWPVLRELVPLLADPMLTGLVIGTASGA